MKKSKMAYDFFDGRLSDRKNRVRLYGFDEAVQQKLADHRDSGESVLLTLRSLLIAGTKLVTAR